MSMYDSLWYSIKLIIYYLGSRHMLLGLGTVWLRPKRAGVRAFCAHERAGAHTSVRVSERVSARECAHRRAGKRADERASARIGARGKRADERASARISARVSERVCVGSRR